MSSLQEPRRIAGVWLTLLLLIIWLLDARVAAYIDPGTGTMMFQLLVVLATGAAMAIRSYWRTLKTTVSAWFVDFPYKRQTAEMFLDAVLASGAYYAAFRLRFGQPVFSGDEYSTFFPGFLVSLPLVLGIQGISLLVVARHRNYWRSFGMMDAFVLVKGVLTGTVLIVFSLTFLYRFELYSRAVFVIYTALLMFATIASRASFQLIRRSIQRPRQA